MDNTLAQLWIDTACPINWFLVIIGALVCSIAAVFIYAVVLAVAEKIFGKIPSHNARALHIVITIALLTGAAQYYEHWRLEKTKRMIRYHKYIQDAWINYRNHAREATREIKYLKEHRH